MLALKVCDPACGSGHFLIAAAHRIAKRLAAVRAGEDEPAPESVQHALRDVVGRCIYGVDINPMAVELCKINLWMEALEPGKPLTFLDHHIRCGNSLLGTTPALMKRGIPDEAFKPIEGDDKKVCSELKRRNKDERRGQGMLPFGQPDWLKLGNMVQSFANLTDEDDSTPEALAAKEQRFVELVKSAPYASARLLADAWSAAFVCDKRLHAPLEITESIFRRWEDNPHSILPGDKEELLRLRDQYNFFHWHLAFPEVFKPKPTDEIGEEELNGWAGGFDCILGNPPWVRQELLKPYKQLLVVFASFTSMADSSVYFLERSVDIARIGGRIALLTPNKWLRANYAQQIREGLRQRSRVDLLIDFGHSRRLFPGVDTFPAAVVLEPVPAPVAETATARFVQAHDEDREEYGLQELIRTRPLYVPHSNLRPDRWQLEDVRESALLDRLTATGRPLGSLLERPILRGLLSGLNAAFYVDTPTRDAIVASDPDSEMLWKKLLRGRDVKRWLPLWGDQWHLVISSSQNHCWPWSTAGSEEDAERIFAATYPSVHAHVKPFEDRLRARQDKGEFWWELRACDYYDEFEKPKVVVQCIAYYAQFAFDDRGYFVNNKAIVIPADDLYLLAVLNSRVMWWIINRTFQHMKDEGLSVDVQFLRRLPVPDASDEVRAQVEHVVHDLLAANPSEADAGQIGPLEIRLNALIEAAFELTSTERDVLVSSLPPRDPLEAFEDITARSTVPAIAVDQVQSGRAVAYLNLLLHTWKKPVVRDALEAGLVFMLNDSIRQRVLRGTRSVQTTATEGGGQFVAGMDSVLTNMKANGAIDTKTDTGRMVVSIGRQPVSIASAPAADVAKAKEAIQAVQKLGESRTAAEYAEVLDVGYELV